MHQTSIYTLEQLPASYHMLYLKYNHFCTYFPLYSVLSLSRVNGLDFTAETVSN